MSYLAVIREFHYKSIEPLLGAARGCSESEVDELEKKLGFTLPAAYREYLLWMGKDYDGIFQGSDCFIDNVMDNNSWMPELLAENRITLDLPVNYLTFFMHQGYVAAWFAIPAEADPQCWYFGEGDTEVPVLRGSFSSVIFTEIQSLLPVLRQDLEAAGK